MQWHIPLIPAPRKQKLIDLFEFKASLVFKVSGWPGISSRILSKKKNQNRRRKTAYVDLWFPYAHVPVGSHTCTQT